MRWSVHEPAGVHRSHRSGFGVGALEGCASNLLLGQLAGHCGFSGFAAALGAGSTAVQGSEDRCQPRKSDLQSSTCVQYLGMLIRHICRESVPVAGSSDLFSGSSDFLHSTFATPSVHVAAVVGSHGFSGALSFLRSHLHASPAVALEGPLVFHAGRPSHSDPFAVGVRPDGSLVVPGQVVVRYSSPGSSPVAAVVFRCSSARLGSSPVGSDGLGGMAHGRKLYAHHCARHEGSIAGSSCLPVSAVEAKCRPDE